MRIEVDQSGKIEQLNMDTYIAFSNHEQYCVKLPKKTKQEIVYENRQKIRQLIQKMFAICVFYCIRNYLETKQLVVIDTEYPGWEAFIKRELVQVLKLHVSLDKDIIRFGNITKDSRAHKLALRTFREEEKPNKIISKEEVMRWLK
jgi:hypothetical protein